MKELNNIDMIISSEELEANQKRTLRKERERKLKKENREHKTKITTLFILLLLNWCSFVVCGFNRLLYGISNIFIINVIVLIIYITYEDIRKENNK